MKLDGKKALVAGLGESGLAMARWLTREGARVRVTDTRLEPPCFDALRQSLPEVEVECASRFDGPCFSGVDIVALSPGVDPYQLPSLSLPVVSEIDLFAHGVARHAPASRMVAITGSNGKSTVTALTAHLLRHSGVSAIACGNISPSALAALMDALDEGKLPQVWVLELSSFQLESTQALRADAAALLNVSADHLDRHRGDMSLYAAAKGRIFAGESVMVLNREDPVSYAHASDGRRMFSFGLNPAPNERDFGVCEQVIYQGSSRLLPLSELRIPGLHNALNAQAALALCAAIGVEARRVLPALRSFQSLPHRVEWVRTLNSVDYFDDSKATNVDASISAICSLGRPVAVILGGDGKFQDFSALAPALAKHGRAVALIGRDAKRIASAIEGCGLPTRRFSGMYEAVRWLGKRTSPGDAVLLSPACASFDMYQDYRARAAHFVAVVDALASPGRRVA